MAEIKQAKQPFTFYTRLLLVELTGLKAYTLNELLTLLKGVPESCIYYHTHSFLQQHQYASPEPPNDFAYWISEILGERELGERLASIDTVRFTNINSLREKLAQVIADYLREKRQERARFAYEGEQFNFMKSVSIILPTAYTVTDLGQFAEALKKITLDSVYFHIFEARLRLKKLTNDFSNWIEESVGDKTLAAAIARLDPYTHTLEDLRRAILMAIERKI